MTTPPEPEELYIFFGDADPDTIPDVVWADFFASAPRIVNDLNDDGYDDLTMGHANDIDIHLGGPTLSQTPDYALSFNGCSNDVINDIVSVGDFNHDGYGDFAAISWGCANGFGKIAIYLGYRWMNPDPVLEITGLSGPLNLNGIWTAAGLGDINGDSLDDFAIGSRTFMGAGRRGRCVILGGDSSYVVPIGNERPELPKTLSLSAFPNPFNSTTTFSYSLPHDSQIKLSLFDLLGRESKIIFEGHSTSGTHSISLTATDLPSGIYFAQLKSASYSLTQKIVLLK